MNKIAIFVEGQSELIFTRQCLLLILGWDKISFKCMKLYSKELLHAPFDYKNESAEVHFLILNVGNDEAVLSAIKDREKGLIRQGYEKIIALRDMYSDQYSKRSPNKIDEDITGAFIESTQLEIAKMSEPARIKMHFAIMELEAWFLSMYNIFERFNSTLNIDYINEKLGFNLSVIDPQSEFFKPADIVNEIFQLVGSRYKKSEHYIESICSKIVMTDFDNAFENERCISFKNFFDEVLNYEY